MPITLGEQNALLYTRWVKRNEAEVERVSKGTLGYVHIPGMNDGAYRRTVEDVFGNTRHGWAWSWTPGTTAAGTWWRTWRCS